MKIFEKGNYVYIIIEGIMHRAIKSKVEILPTHDERHEYFIFGFKDISSKDSFSMHHFTKEDGSAFANVEEFEDFTANISIASTAQPIDNTRILEEIRDNTTKLDLENVTYKIQGLQKIVFGANTISSYSIYFEIPSQKFKEVNETFVFDKTKTISKSLENGLLLNAFEITNMNTDSKTIISVLQLVGTSPTITG
jgi:Zn-dependent M16 (insulinase) family peptidase